MSARTEVERLANVCRGYVERNHAMPYSAGVDLLSAVESLLAELRASALTAEEREDLNWAHAVLLADERDKGKTAQGQRALAVLARLVGEATHDTEQEGT